MSHNPKIQIKCEFANAVHKMLELNIDKPKYLRWKYKKISDLTNEEKLELFDKIVEIHNSTSYKFTNYINKKKYKEKIRQERLKRKSINS